jgi:hypothetical protein
MWFFVTKCNTREKQFEEWSTEPYESGYLASTSSYAVIRTVSVRLWKEAAVVWFEVLSGSAWRGSVQLLNRVFPAEIETRCVHHYPAYAFKLKFCALFLVAHAHLLTYPYQLYRSNIGTNRAAPCPHYSTIFYFFDSGMLFRTVCSDVLNLCASFMVNETSH